MSRDYNEFKSKDNIHPPSSKKSPKIVKWLYIILLIFILYMFYHKITSLIMDYFKSNPTVYNDFLYFSSQIKNSTLPGLFYISILGALFFLAIPMEAIFIYYLSSTFHSALAIIAIIVIGSVIGLTINYFMGWVLGDKVLKKFFDKENYEKYKNYISKYGGVVIIVGNIIPSPIEPLTLLYGGFNYDYKKFFILSLIGRIIKYLILFIAFYFFWDQIMFFYDDLIQKLNPLNYVSF